MNRLLLVVLLLIMACVVLFLGIKSPEPEVIVDPKHWKNERYYRYTEILRNEDGSRSFLLRPTAPSHIRAPNQESIERFTNGRNEQHDLNIKMQNKSIPSVDELMNEVENNRHNPESELEGMNLRRPMAAVAAYKSV